MKEASLLSKQRLTKTNTLLRDKLSKAKKIIANKLYFQLSLSIIIGISAMSTGILDGHKGILVKEETPKFSSALISLDCINSISGTVFLDANFDGANNDNSGIEGINIIAYDCDNNMVGSDLTDMTGEYIISATTINETYRVELDLSSIPSSFKPGPSGQDNESTVRFWNPGSCLDFGIVNPESCNESLVAAVCFARNNDATSEPTIVFVNTNDARDWPGPANNNDNNGLWGIPSGSSAGNYPLTFLEAANVGELNTTFGMDFDADNTRLITGSYMRAYAPMNTNASNNGYAEAALYQIPMDLIGGVANAPSLWLDLEVLLSDGVAGEYLPDNNYPGPTAYGRTGSNPNLIGYTGLGSIKVSQDRSELYVVNLNRRSVYVIPIGPNGEAPSSSSDIKEFLLPNTECSGSWPDGRDLRAALGLGIHPESGRVYASLTCTGPTYDDVTGYIYSFDPSDDTPSASDFDMELTVPLNITRPATSPNTGTFWAQFGHSWESVNANTVFYLNDPRIGGNIFNPIPNEKNTQHNQPWLGEVEFGMKSDGSYSMVIGERNRYHDLISSSWYVAGGVIYKACGSEGNWSISSENECSTDMSAVNFSYSGSNAGVYTSPSNRYMMYVGREGSMGSGMLTVPKGTPYVVSPVMDNLFNSATSGLTWLNTTTGAREKDIRILGTYAAGGFNNTNFTKANNWGAIAGMCIPNSIEIGNYVWLDLDGNGIQNACEVGIPNVVVEFYNQDGTLLLGSTMTNSEGQYYFNDENVNQNGANGILAETEYVIKIPNASGNSQQSALNLLIVTDINASEDNIDSDGVSMDDMVIIEIMTGESGCSDHTFDIGFKEYIVCSSSSTDITCFDAANGVISVTAEAANGEDLEYSIDGANYFDESEFTDLAPGTYDVSVRLVNDIAIVINCGRIELLNPPGITLNITDKDVTCGPLDDGGSIKVEVLNAIGALDFDWSDDDYDGLSEILNAPVESYSLTVTDENGCTAEGVVEITQEECLPDPCEEGELGGSVFNDNNANGQNDGSPEDGFQGIKAQIFKCDENGKNTLIETVYTDVNGNYHFTDPSIQFEDCVYQIVFSNLPDGYISSSIGADNGTDVQVVSALGCNYNYGILHPDFACATPDFEESVVVGDDLFSTGTLLGPGIGLITCGTIVNLPADERHTVGLVDIRGINTAGDRPEVNPNGWYHPSWNVDNIGNVFGIDYDTTGNIYVTASSHYSHVYGYILGPDASNYTQSIIKYGDLGGGTDDLGAAGTVYKLDAVTGVASVFAQLPQQAFAFNHIACEAADPPLSRTTGPGLGNIVFDQVNNQFFVSNFEDGKIYRLNTDGDTINSFDPQTLDVFDPYDGSSGWATDAKPYGLAVNNDGTELFFGTHELNVSPGLYSVSLDSNGDFDGTEIHHDIYSAEGDIGYIFAAEPGWVAISDLEFLPNGQIMIGLRTGCGGEYATSHNHGATFYIVDEEGDGIYDNIVSNPDIQYPNDGTGNDDGYGGIGIWDKHDGTYDFLVSSSDTRTEEGPHGMILFPHDFTNGNSGFSLQPSAAIPYLPSFNVQDFKGIGGDVEVFSPCGNAPAQVGNFAWIDANGDGIQDACESPMVNLTVKLFSKPNTGDPELIATTITNESGEYYFSDSMNIDQDWEPSFANIELDSSYFVVFCGENYNPDGEILNVGGLLFSNTIANEDTSLGEDMTDSDITNVTVPTFGDFPGVCITVTETDFTFDAGFVPKPDLALIQVLDPDYDFTNLKFGDSVKFKITVFNQSLGSVDSIQITDYVPDGFTFDETTTGNEMWSSNGAFAQAILSNGLAAGAKDSICIYLILEKSDDPEKWINVAEISNAWSNGESVEDCDSELNQDPEDNGGGEINTEADDEVDGDGTATEQGGDPTTDQDNVDPATVPICDLALVNTVVELPATLKLGDTIKYAVIIENQGTVPTTNIEIDYTIPNGLTYLDSNDDLVPAWNVGIGEAMSTIADVLNIGEKDTICIYLLVNNVSTDEVTPESWTTFAEIASYEDPNDPGVDKSDVDSSPDGDPTNDSGGNPTDDTDDVTTGDGTGDPEDPNEDSDPLLDEDDHDPAIIYVCDAATIIYTDHDESILYGDTVKFSIVVFNQGNGPITNIDINDFYGDGLEYISTEINDAQIWNDADNQASTTLTEMINPGESDTICLELLVMDVIPFDEDAYLQIVEIEEFEDPAAVGIPKIDIDSTPDNDPENDSGGNPEDDTDDEVDGNGTGDPENPNEDSDPEMDEDDNDPVLISIFDLALDKVIIEDIAYAPGEKPVFEITVYNQGNVTVDNYKITDYLRDGFTFSTMNNPGWNMLGDNIVYTSGASIAPGGSYTITLELTVVIPAMPMGVSDWWNFAEISEADDNSNSNDTDPIDADSTPNSNEMDDNPVEPGDSDDNIITENGNEGDDEDDHDPEAVIVGYDLALRKTVAPEGPYSYDDTLTYTIEIFNQGGLSVSEIDIYDDVPCGLLFIEELNDWDIDGSIATTTLEEVLAPGSSVTKELRLIVQRCDSPAYNNYLNNAEISDFLDGEGEEPLTEDLDSTPDSEIGNDEDPIDNETNENPTNGGDEDDHDIEDIVICDLALINTIVEIPDAIKVGDTVKYEVIVFNQGNHDVNSVTIDYDIPNGLSYFPINNILDPAWTGSNDEAGLTTTKVLTPGDSDTLCLYLQLENVPTDEVTQGSWTTVSEITEYTNGDDETKITDADSTPDNDPTNDPGGNPEDDTDDEIDGEGTGDPNDPIEDTDPELDEDDHDPAIINICDIATIIYHEVPDDINYFDTLKFNVVVFNQGNGEITNVNLIDHLPDGLEFIETSSNLAEGWEESEEDEALELLYEEVLGVGESDTICLELQIVPIHDASDEEGWLQIVEVESFEDPANPGDPKSDIDSAPDSDPENDPGGNPEDDTDDETDGEGTGDPEDEMEDMDPTEDEDDHDPVDIKVLDLALIMQIDSMPPVLPVVPGDVLKFIVVVANQGNTPVNEIEITNYLMDNNLELADVSGNKDWVSVDSESNETVVAGELLPGDIDTVCIYMEVLGGAMSDIVTYSEISGSTETNGGECYDIDSTPDDMNDNDEGGTPVSIEDDHIEDDGEDGNEDGITDEDDHDPAMLDVQDLGLIVWAENKLPVLEGDDVKFTIRVINQGNILNENIELVDYIPSGFELSENDTYNWTVDPLDPKKVYTTLSSSLDMGDTIETCIILTVQDGVSAEDLINYAEIVSSTGPEGLDLNPLDVDSTPNNDNGDDEGGQHEDMPDCTVDPVVINDDNNVEGSGIIGEDEDDHDPAWVHVFDLASIIYTDQTLPVIPGDEVKFNVVVENQGNMSATGIDLLIDMPTGFTLSINDENGWDEDGSDLSTTYEGVIIPETTDTICLILEVLPDHMFDDLVPIVEIAGAMDTLGNDQSEFDLDSDPNEDVLDDEGGEIFTGDDDNLDGNGEDGNDEDDQDPAVPPVMDLAIKIVTEDEAPKVAGDLVKFVITVYNQGSLTPSEFSIENYVPEGLVFLETSQNLGWASSGSANATYVYSEELAPLTSDTICIYLLMDTDANPLNVVDMVEISEVFDQNSVDVSLLDIDSEADASNENDLGNDLYSPEDNKVDENGRSGFDEDDHDQAFVLMCQGMSCKGTLNFSIDESCTGSLTPRMLLTGDIFPDFIYEITVKDENGVIVPNAFGIGDINKTFEVSISNPLCYGNSCWLPVTVEYKFDPIIECVANDTLSCTQAFSEASEPSIESNCISSELLLIEEQFELLDCNEDFTSSMTRKWIAKDDFGNFSDTCTQTIFLERTELDSLVPVQNFMIANNNAISCDSGYSTIGNTAFPDLSVTGAPKLTVDGKLIDIYPFESSVICNGFADFEDEILIGSTNCVTKILRTFTIGEWWCGGTNTREFKQLIEIVDFNGPTVSCPADMTISTGSFECVASVTVPLPQAMDECNDDLVYNLGTPTGVFENYNGQSFDLGVGVHTLQYAVYDACEQGSFCSFKVTVVDNADPIAICDQFTEVSLSLETTTYVTAEAIDDGSFDECGLVTLSVARVDDPGFDDFTGFGPTVDISCTDAGQTVMVGLLVTDAGGNTNMCMVSVNVKDKIEAQMVCPVDTTVECNFTFDPENLSAFFGEVQIFDNCPGANTLDESIVGELNSCGSGVLIRQIRLLNAQGDQTDYCEQNITFVSGTPLQYSDITPPNSPVEVSGCGIGALDAANVQMPIIPDGVCQQVAISIDNDTFPFTEEGACLKIIRTYKVIDWCIPNGPGSVYFPFEFEQIIKVSNSVKPTFTNVFIDSTYCSFAGDCGGIEVTGLTATSSDDCTVESDLIRKYETRNSDDNIVKFGDGHDASGLYDLGDYTVTFIAEDKCGNQQVTTSTFSIVSCKQPVPYCLNGLSTSLTLMDPENDGEFVAMVMLNTGFFDAGSYHPCGLDVTLSFSSDTTDKQIIFDCDGIGEQDVQLWVTDSNGNQDYCIASLDVQDNENLCSLIESADIQGRIYTPADAELNEAMVQLISSEMQEDMTDEYGEYGFMNMQQGGSYSVAPHKDDDVLNGVSTLDLVMIQRHILGLAEFDEVHKFIAADVNHDDKLTATDLVTLRKAILGINTHFTNNTSWRFIDEQHVFEDETDPWSAPFAESYDISELSDDMWIDFVAVKVGDVNGNVDANLKAGFVSETRSAQSLIMNLPNTYLEEGKVYEIEVMTSEAINLRGLQIAFSLNELELIEIEQGAMNIKSNDILTTADELKMSYANAIGDYAQADDVLYTIVLRAKSDGLLSEMIEINDKSLNAEAYLGSELKVGSVEIEWREIDDITPLELMVAGSVSPNPWRSQAEINFEIPRAGTVDLIIRDASGRVLSTKSDDFSAGKQSFTITNDDVKITGILLYELKFGEQVVRKKMIRLE